MVSVSASMATLAFNNAFWENSKDYLQNFFDRHQKDDMKFIELMYKKLWAAMFDSRVFTLPKEEVVNCLIWRQQDCVRNSIQSVGQANFSHKQLEGKNCSDIQDMLMTEKSINWNDYPTHLKRGSCCIKKLFKINEGTEKETIRNKWVIDNEIPIFTQNKDYINKLIFI